MLRRSSVSRASRLRLTAAIGVVLASTLVGGQAMALPASAPASIVVTATTGDEPGQAVVPYPTGRTTLASVGSTGFLTWQSDGRKVWTRFADGSSTTLTSQWAAIGSKASDVVMIDLSGSVVDVKDMSTGSRVMLLDPPPGQIGGAVGRTVFVRNPNSAGGEDVRLVAMVDGQLSTRTVTGLPQDAAHPVVWAGTPGHAVLVYQTPRGWQWALVDVAAGTVVQLHDMTSSPTSFAVSETRVAWAETNAIGKTSVVVAPRGTGTGAEQRIPLGATGGKAVVGLAGDWVTYGLEGGLLDQEPNPLYGLTARNLTTGATRKVLDHVLQTAAAPDGTLYASGGTLAGGEGLYRIVPGADGVPAATLVASSGEPTKVTLLGTKIPAVIDLDKTGGRFRLEWTVSRNNVEMTVTLRNTRTGDTFQDRVNPLAIDGYADTHRAYLDWDGGVLWNSAEPDVHTGAPSGPYTWTIDGRPLNGIGPNLVASGSFTVARKPGLHDYDADGYPDVLARDTAGRLWLSDTYDEYRGLQLQQHVSTLVGSGWNTYDRIEASGDLGGAAVGDLVARDRSGVLWLYQGTGNAKAPFASRIRIGGGWNTYTQFAGGSDLTGDGRADLLATDKAGVLWLCKGTGNYRAPFAPRVRIGVGWSAYNQITATGNIAGSSAGDLVARDRSGVLWLYAGRGNGTLAPRVRIGSGWNAYHHLVAIGDANRDGPPDLYATDVWDDGHGAYLYKSTGDATKPLAPRAQVGVVFNSSRIYNLFI